MSALSFVGPASPRSFSAGTFALPDSPFGRKVQLGSAQFRLILQLLQSLSVQLSRHTDLSSAWTLKFSRPCFNPGFCRIFPNFSGRKFPALGNFIPTPALSPLFVDR